MTFMAIVVVFALVQYWGSAEGFHKDEWYLDWIQTVNRWSSSTAARVLGQVVLPVLALWLLLGALGRLSSILVFLVSIAVLLYSLGRGDYRAWLSAYAEAFRRNDNESATEYASQMGVETDKVDGWSELHHQVLRRGGYLGLERWFTVIFWFVILGPVGALFYRLGALAQGVAKSESTEVDDAVDGYGELDTVRDESESETLMLLARLLWLLEWPVVRLLGLSFALTGNFVGCIHHWKECLLCTDRSTEDTMEHFIHGALNVNNEDITQDGVTELEVEALMPLLSRSLVLWLCVLAVLTLL